MTVHSESQIDLFAPSARFTEVIAFPLSRVASEVRAVAIELLELADRADRDRAWKRIVKRHRKRLEALGLDRRAVHSEIARFRVAVLCEARRRVILGLDSRREA